MKKVLLLLLSLAMVSVDAAAFDLSSLLNKEQAGEIVNKLVSKSDLEVSDLVGTWSYKSPAVAFESEDFLKKAGGDLVATTVEKKMESYYKRAGLEDLSLTINADSTFTMQFRKGKLSGVMSKLENGKFLFKFNALGKLKIAQSEAFVKKGVTLQLAFDVSKLLDLVNRIATYSKSTSSSSIAKMLEGYSGMYLGFEFDHVK